MSILIKKMLHNNLHSVHFAKIQKIGFLQKYQRGLFNQLLGKGQGEKFIKGTYYLARGHLAPDGDFLYGSWQWSTYFYVNTAPQWQIINAGHWLALERYLRKFAEQVIRYI